MLGAIKYNLTHLLDFSGRDARQTFWSYVLFLFVVNIAIGMVLGIAIVASLIGSAVDAAQAGASEEAMQAEMAARMGGFVDGIVWYSLASNAAMYLLIAASFVRRLHDSNSSGWWGLAVLVALVIGSVVSIDTMGTMREVMTEAMSRTDPMGQAEIQEMMRGQSQAGSLGLVAWIAPLMVIVFGVMDSSKGPNRFGEEPVRF